jgi:hypothetical protein
VLSRFFIFFCKTTKKIQNQKKLYIDITLKTKMEKKDIAKQKKKERKENKTKPTKQIITLR